MEWDCGFRVGSFRLLISIDSVMWTLGNTLVSNLDASSKSEKCRVLFLRRRCKAVRIVSDEGVCM